MFSLRKKGHTTWGRLIGLAVLLCAAGCRPKKPADQRDAEPIVKRVEFEGVSRFKRRELIEYLQVKADSPWSRFGITDKSYWIKGRIRADKKRIVELYKASGYYDAEVVDVRAEAIRGRENRVRIVFVVEEGEPIRLSMVDYQFASSVPNPFDIIDKATLKEGDAADVAALNASKMRIERALLSEGYAYAAVNESMTVDLASRHAEATFEITPGPKPTIGRLVLSGLKDIPEDLVQQEVSDYAGKFYTPALKEQIENELLGMNIFNVVSVSKRDVLDENGQLVLDVLLVEGNPQRLKIGIGWSFEPDKNLATTSSLYAHRNMFGRLYGFEMRSSAGYAVMPDFFHMTQHGPVVTFEPSLTKKGLLEKELRWVLKTSVDMDVEEDYKYIGPTGSLTVSRFFWEKTLASLGYHFEAYFFYQSKARWEETLAALYPELASPFLHGFIEAKYRVMLTDRPADPKNGAIFEVVYGFSHKALGSDTNYHRIHPRLRLYLSIGDRVQLAARGEAGFLFPFRGTHLTMQWSNFHLGGYNSMRGWGGKRLSPTISFCRNETDCDTVRIGGRTMLMGNLELRIRTFKDLFVVTFVDVGDVQYGVWTFAPKAWNYTVGMGVRLKTGIGKIRLDIGVRVNNPAPYRDEPRQGIHLGLGEAF